MERNKNKQHLNLIIIGHQHSGKSTVTGHLVCTNGTDKIKALQFENEAQAKKFDTNILKYTWVLEKLKEERDRGMVLKLSLWSFETPNYIVNVIDAPGRNDSLCETASGLTQVDCAVLVVSACIGEFETSVSEFGLTYTHALIAYTLGVKQLIVCVNKMDLTFPPYSQGRFEAISCDLKQRIENIGYDIKTVPFIPISCCHNDNVSAPSTNTPWYSGWSFETSRGRFSGKTLIDAIDSLRPLSESELTNKVKRLPLEDKDDSICKELMNDFLDALVEEIIEHVVNTARKTTHSMFYDVTCQPKIDMQSIIDHTNKMIEHFNCSSICKSIESNASSTIPNHGLHADQTDDVESMNKLIEPAYRDMPTAPPLYSEKFSRNALQPLGPPPQYELYCPPYQSAKVITSQPVSANSLQQSSGYSSAYRRADSNDVVTPVPIILPIPVPDSSLPCCCFMPPYSICNFGPDGHSCACCHCNICECECFDGSDCSGCDCGGCDCSGCDCSGCDCGGCDF